ncbi:hypothetical protein PPERSA_02479 [Pseudocohnilembus persalinus]|uniref:Uncharacterized protein n=1 Tax=Pseudocohnilembus persalinus TaxID=266149 RepID=A0A0V0QBA8_PSEPJ|nr:hypothetical protein PPERSA_02479 [Pseudocohnilembus persalinus]|eukprot:KRW99367.1 hypothetical protein PPERSA_02479 [Pseudocohnilembus persalinus]
MEITVQDQNSQGSEELEQKLASIENINVEILGSFNHVIKINSVNLELYETQVILNYQKKREENQKSIENEKNNEKKEQLQLQICFLLENTLSFGKKQNDFMVYLTKSMNEEIDDDEQDQNENLGQIQEQGQNIDQLQQQENVQNGAEKTEFQGQNLKDEILELIEDQQVGQFINLVGDYEIKIVFDDNEKILEFENKFQEAFNNLQVDEDLQLNGQNEGEFDMGEMITAKDINDDGQIIKQFNDQNDQESESEITDSEGEQSQGEEQKVNQEEVPKIINKKISKNK